MNLFPMRIIKCVVIKKIKMVYKNLNSFSIIFHKCIIRQIRMKEKLYLIIFEMQKLRDDRSQDTCTGKNCINLNAQLGFCIIILLLHVLFYNSMSHIHENEMVYEKISSITSVSFFCKNLAI